MKSYLILFLFLLLKGLSSKPMDAAFSTHKSIEKKSCKARIKDLVKNKKKYIGQPVSKAFEKIGCDWMALSYDNEPPGRLNYISFKFEKNFWLDVKVKDFKHVQRFSAEMKWDVFEYLKEDLFDLQYRDK